MLKKKLYILGSVFYFILPPFLLKKLNSILRWIYSGYQSKRFCKCGIDLYIDMHSTIVGGQYINIGDYVCIGERAVLTAWDRLEYEPQVLIGNNTIVGDDCHITAINKVIIGSNVLMGKKITITDNSHGKVIDNDVHPSYRKLYSKGPVIIGDYVWIGDKATILPGVTIGANSIIGANSVVTKDVPPNSIAVGNPAIINHVD